MTADRVVSVSHASCKDTSVADRKNTCSLKFYLKRDAKESFQILGRSRLDSSHCIFYKC